MSRRNRRNNNNYDDLCSGFQNLSVNHGGHFSGGSSQPRFQQNRPLVNPNRAAVNNSEFKPVSYRNVHPSEMMYQKIMDLMEYDLIKVQNLVEVNNPILQQAYTLKKKQNIRQYGQVYENLLFHGTRKANLNDICTYNFDWRLNGTNKGHKFGQGVSFSVSDKYASNYCDEDNYHKVMIVAKVLISNACQGHANMTLPPPGFDTSQNKNGSVVVKYQDNEFYPAYKLYYHLEEEEDDDDYEEEYYTYDYGFDHDHYHDYYY